MPMKIYASKDDDIDTLERIEEHSDALKGKKNLENLETFINESEKQDVKINETGIFNIIAEFMFGTNQIPKDKDGKKSKKKSKRKSKKKF